MKLIGKAIILGMAVAATSIIACSSNHSATSTGSNTPPASTTPGAGTPSENGSGSVGFQYTLPGGEHITNVTYTLTNGTNTYTGTVNVGSSSVISFLIPGVFSGTGYSIVVTGVTDDGLDKCIGSVGAANPYANPPGSVVGTTFSVVNRATTIVNVNMICLDLQNLDAGSVQVNAVTSCCATWDTATAVPASANTSAPGNTSLLSANASGPCGNTDAGTNPVLNCVWTVTSGTGIVSATTGDGTGNFASTFTCPTVNENDIITLTCTDGPLPDGGSCPAWSTTTTVQVSCGTPPCTTGSSPGGMLGDPANPPPPATTGSCAAYGGGFVNDGTGCCYAPCAASGNEPATPFSGTGSCAAFPGTSNNGAGCCQPLHPCIVAGDATCVKCNGNASGLCTPTEAKVVQRDINKGISTVPGNSPANSCYACLVGNSCIDDTVFSDTGHECEDTITGSTTTAECSAVLTCLLGSTCGNAGNLATCYCGSLSNAACKNNPITPTGACDTQIAGGTGFPLTDGTDNFNNLTNVGLAAGRADQIINCAIQNVGNAATTCANCTN